ncbi:MAG: transglutaminase-like domain-containing protein [Balneolaceae bacterium]
MTDSINRRKFLRMTGAAGLGLGVLSTPAAANLSAENRAPCLPDGIRAGKPASRSSTDPYGTEHAWTAAELWSRSVSDGLNYVNGAIELDDHILVEDDAPGLGAIQSQVWETIEPGVILQKQLRIDRWPVRQAILSMMVYPVEPPAPMSGGKLQFRVNGNEPIIYEVRHSWTSVTVPAAYLRQGENTIEVTVTDDGIGFRTPVALHSNYRYGSRTRTPPSPQRSRRSRDGGTSWEQGLGASGDNSGEYPIRLKLRGYREKGWLQTEIIDLSGTADVLHFPAAVESARIDLDASRTGGSGNLTVYLRHGHTHRPETGGWSDWERQTQSELPAGMQNRFIQLKLEAASDTGDATPRIRNLRLNSRLQPVPSDARKEIHLTGSLNRPLIDSPFDFQHEDPVYPALQELREEYGLDDVVEGARTEMEVIMRLRNWAAARWNWFMPSSDLEDMISWDSRRILDPGDSREPGGYCLYFSIVFAQACQSFGIPARMVNINYAVFGGHEVAEVWSREYNKWIMIDANFDSMFVSQETGEPLNVLELHDIFLETYYPGGEIIDRDAWTYEERDRRSEPVDPETLPIRMQTDGHALSGQIGSDYVWWKVTDAPAPGYAGGYGFFNTAYVRWLPRSNWLSRPLPMPITHGRTHWGWDGYLAWADPQTPETPEHRHFVRRKSDMYERLFTVDFSAEPSADSEKNVLEIRMATDSPGFAHYELSDNGNGRTTGDSVYRWQLAPGLNNLTMRTVDVLGNRGPESEVTVNYMPA